MSYKLEWVAILANFKTKINAYLANPNIITVRDLEEVQNEFIAFVNGYSVLLSNDAYNTQAIDAFNQVYLNRSNTVSDNDTINNLQTLIDSFDTAITHNKEEKMTTNYNVSGNARSPSRILCNCHLD